MTDDADDADLTAIHDVVRAFLGAFTTGPGCAERLDALPDLFVPGAVVVRAGGGEPTVDDVEGFVAPRRALLLGGTLVDFHEWPLAGRTEVFGDVAHHVGGYAKAGVQDGVDFTARGLKTIQLVRTGAGWRISAVAWDDEREGLVLPPGFA